MKNPDNLNNKKIVSYLNNKYKKLLDELCENRDQTESYTVRKIIEDYFNKRDFKNKYKK